MKKLRYLLLSLGLIGFFTACEDEEWDTHYAQKDPVIHNTEIEFVDQNVTPYLKSQAHLSKLSEIFESEGVYKSIDSKNQMFTLIVFPDEKLEGKTIEDTAFLAKSLVCDLYIAPSKCTDGMQLLTWCGKYLGVTVTEETVTDSEETMTEKVLRIGGQKIKRIIKLNNAFVYELEEGVFVPKSIYEYLEWLDDATYSKFKALVHSYEVKEFDKDASTPSAVDNTGNTVYDSVFIISNSFMDRYKKNNYKDLKWSMREEFSKTTMLIPTNEQIEKAFQDACDYVINSLRRQLTMDDTVNFNEWILNACFYEGVLTPEQLAASATEDVKSVSGYCKKYDASVEASQWRPSVQRVNTGRQVELSNGVAYYIESLKIPNNVVLWRIKSRAYFCWAACTAEQKEEYFQWENINTVDKLSGLISGPNAPGGRSITAPFGPFGDFPQIDYTALVAPPSRAVCSPDSAAYGGAVSLTFKLIALNADGTVSPVLVPPGEYYLRAGASTMKRQWTANWYMKDNTTNSFNLIRENWVPGDSWLDRYGDGFPKYFNPNLYSKGNNYDKDGIDVATVTISGDQSQEVVLKIESLDMYKNKDAYKATQNECFSLYCWTLRPTSNNY